MSVIRCYILGTRVYKKETDKRRYKIHPYVIIDIPGIRLCFEDLFFNTNIEECTKRLIPKDEGFGQIYRLETVILENFKDEISKMKK